MSEYQSTRLILRASDVSDASAEVSRYAEAGGFRLIQDVAADPSRGVERQLTWLIATQLWLQYTEDLETGLPYVHVVASVANFGLSYIRQAEQHLSVYTWDELLAGADAAPEGETRAKALLRLALGSPQQYEPALAERIFRAGQSPDEAVRVAAVYATSYSPSGRYRPFLRELAANDPAARVRRDATNMLGAFDDMGIGDE